MVHSLILSIYLITFSVNLQVLVYDKEELMDYVEKNKSSFTVQNLYDTPDGEYSAYKFDGERGFIQISLHKDTLSSLWIADSAFVSKEGLKIGDGIENVRAKIIDPMNVSYSIGSFVYTQLSENLLCVYDSHSKPSIDGLGELKVRSFMMVYTADGHVDGASIYQLPTDW